MAQSQLEVKRILEERGIAINGKNPWDIQVKNPLFFDSVLSHGSLGLGESYMDGWWDASRLDEFFARLLSKPFDRRFLSWRTLLLALKWRLFNPAKSNAYDIGKLHYDKGNILYENMLGKRLVYTCGYWKNAKGLDQAQEHKLDLVCKKIGLRKGDKVLDIGCGWGSFCRFAAEKYKARVVGITVSEEQVKLGRKLCEGLPVEIRYQDYREVNEKFDHIISLGMFEHVGYKNYREYFEMVHRCLRDTGLFLLHTIGGNVSVKSIDPWIGKYIFPNSMLPSVKQIASASEGLFVMEDWHNFSADYDKTLMAWFRNFDDNWDFLSSFYNERFHRMWKYYLLACAGTFRARKNQLWQIVFSKNGVKGGYKSVR